MTTTPRPYTLIAEVTYKCPLACLYCSNPVRFGDHASSLSTSEWSSVLEAASDLGVLQAHFTGGEPLLRSDLEVLIARARALGLYTNLITSGVTLTRDRLERIAKAGIDNVQLSFQALDSKRALEIAGRDHHDQKLRAATWIKDLNLPLTINVVLHRLNIDRVDEFVSYAEELGADRLELANTQYQGWALVNRDFLIPSRDQVERAALVAEEASRRLRGRIELLFVKPDYFGNYPRSCMDGWARRFVVVTPDGLVLPCHAARAIESLHFESVRERSLAAIWRDSPALLTYRGRDWMQEPCTTCERREVDFGGCRCQAFQLTGDPASPDPACARTSTHELITLAVSRRASIPAPQYRDARLSRAQR